MKHLYTAEATAFGAAQENVKTDGFDLKLSVPKELGGEGGDGTNPEQLIAASYATCFQAALGIVGKRMDVSFSPDMEVHAQVDLLENGDAFDFKIHLQVKNADVEQEHLQELLEKTLEVCPITRATKNSTATIQVS